MWLFFSSAVTINYSCFISCLQLNSFNCFYKWHKVLVLLPILCVTSTSIQQRSHDFYSLGGVGVPVKLVRPTWRGSFLLPRGRASGRTNKRIAVLVDNCCACFVFCWLISVGFCVAFSFILCVVLFVIKLIKYNDWSFPSLGRKWTPRRVEWEMRQGQ